MPKETRQFKNRGLSRTSIYDRTGISASSTESETSSVAEVSKLLAEFSFTSICSDVSLEQPIHRLDVQSLVDSCEPIATQTSRVLQRINTSQWSYSSDIGSPSARLEVLILENSQPRYIAELENIDRPLRLQHGEVTFVVTPMRTSHMMAASTEPLFFLGVRGLSSTDVGPDLYGWEDLGGRLQGVIKCIECVRIDCGDEVYAVPRRGDIANGGFTSIPVNDQEYLAMIGIENEDAMLALEGVFTAHMENFHWYGQVCAYCLGHRLPLDVRVWREMADLVAQGPAEVDLEEIGRHSTVVGEVWRAHADQQMGPRAHTFADRAAVAVQVLRMVLYRAGSVQCFQAAKLISKACLNLDNRFVRSLQRKMNAVRHASNRLTQELKVGDEADNVADRQDIEGFVMTATTEDIASMSIANKRAMLAAIKSVGLSESHKGRGDLVVIQLMKSITRETNEDRRPVSSTMTAEGTPGALEDFPSSLEVVGRSYGTEETVLARPVDAYLSSTAETRSILDVMAPPSVRSSRDIDQMSNHSSYVAQVTSSQRGSRTSSSSGHSTGERSARVTRRSLAGLSTSRSGSSRTSSVQNGDEVHDVLDVDTSRAAIKEEEPVQIEYLPTARTEESVRNPASMREFWGLTHRPTGHVESRGLRPEAQEFIARPGANVGPSSFALEMRETGIAASNALVRSNIGAPVLNTMRPAAPLPAMGFHSALTRLRPILPRIGTHQGPVRHTSLDLSSYVEGGQRFTTGVIRNTLSHGQGAIMSVMGGSMVTPVQTNGRVPLNAGNSGATITDLGSDHEQDVADANLQRSRATNRPVPELFDSPAFRNPPNTVSFSSLSGMRTASGIPIVYGTNRDAAVNPMTGLSSETTVTNTVQNPGITAGVSPAPRLALPSIDDLSQSAGQRPTGSTRNQFGPQTSRALTDYLISEANTPVSLSACTTAVPVFPRDYTGTAPPLYSQARHGGSNSVPASSAGTVPTTDTHIPPPSGAAPMTNGASVHTSHADTANVTGGRASGFGTSTGQANGSARMPTTFGDASARANYDLIQQLRSENARILQDKQRAEDETRMLRSRQEFGMNAAVRPVSGSPCYEQWSLVERGAMVAREINDYLDDTYRKVYNEETGLNWGILKEPKNFLQVTIQIQLPQIGEMNTEVGTILVEIKKWRCHPECALVGDDLVKVTDVEKALNNVRNEFTLWQNLVRKQSLTLGVGLKRDTSGLVSPIKLDVFTGYDNEYTIFAYLVKWTEIYGDLLPTVTDRVHILYNQGLSAEIKVQMREYQDDYISLVAQLKIQYGKADKIFKYQIERLHKLVCKDAKDPKKRAQYLRLFHSKLNSLMKDVGGMSAREKGKYHRELYSTGVLTKVKLTVFERLETHGAVLKRIWEKKSFGGDYVKSKRLERTMYGLEDDEDEEETGDQSNKCVLESFLAFLDENAVREESCEEQRDRDEEYGFRRKPGGGPPKDPPAGRGRGDLTHVSARGRGRGRGAGIHELDDSGLADSVLEVGRGKQKSKKKRKGILGALLADIGFGLDSNGLAIKGAGYRISITDAIVCGGTPVELATTAFLKNINTSGGPPTDGIAHDGRGAPDFDRGCETRCFVCVGKAHELGLCEVALKLKNHQRLASAILRKVCHYCLRRDCFAQRMKVLFEEKKKKKSDANYKMRNVWDECSNEKLNCPCFQCVKEDSTPKAPAAEPTTKVVREHKLHMLLCPHEQNAAKNEETLKKTLPKYQKSSIKANYFLGHRMFVRSAEKLLEDLPEMIAEARSTGGIHRAGKNKRKKGAGKQYAYDTQTGGMLSKQDIPINNDIVKESDEASVFYLQSIRIGEHSVTLFSDSGASGGCVLGDLAEKWELELIDDRVQAISTAGGQILITGYGVYSLCLGPCSDNKFYQFNVLGLPSITGVLPKYDLTNAVKTIRKHDDENGRLLGSEAFPQSVGGQGVGILLGINNPILLPEVIMIHPAGLVLARSKLFDQWGSRLLFGGTHESFTAAYEAYGNTLHRPSNLPGGVQFAGNFGNVFSMDVGVKSYFSDIMLAYRNSVRTEPISALQYLTHVEAQKEAIQVRVAKPDKCAKECIVQEPVDDINLEKLRELATGRTSRVGYAAKLARKYLAGRKSNRPNLPDLTDSDDDSDEEDDADEGFDSGIDIQEEVTGCLDVTGTALEGEGRLYAAERTEENCLERGFLRMFVEADCIGSRNNIELQSDRVVQPDIAFSTQVSDQSDARAGSRFSTLCDSRERGQGSTLYSEDSGNRDLESGQVGTDSYRQAHQNSGASTDSVSTGGYSEHSCTHCACIVDIDITSPAYLELSERDKFRVNKIKKLVREWEEAEELGTVVDYRCPDCQKCPECLKEGRLRNRSVREEDEQCVIEKSITIDYGSDSEPGKTWVRLPFIKAPIGLHEYWGSNTNYRQAYAILQQQLRNPKEAREDLCKFLADIHGKGFCQKLSTLPEEIQEEVMNAVTRHFFPWRGVWKGSSITTPCRMVVDPLVSHLNEFLAKGKNQLQNLQSLLLEFRSYPYVAGFDITKMYNNLWMDPRDFCYNLFLWIDELNPENPVEIWVFTRAMYGVVSTGNQAESAIRRAARKLEDEFPLGAEAIINHVYVDDGLPHALTMHKLILMIGQAYEILYCCGFNVKCLTIVGDEFLSAKASSDGVSTGVCGMKWYPHKDLLSLASGEMNFSKSVRGRKTPNKHKVECGRDIDEDILPEILTRRDCVAKTMELYDITGVVEPLKAKLKIALAMLVDLGLGWRDPVPDDLLPMWIGPEGNFAMIQDVRDLKWRRAVVPKDAVEMKVRLINIHDASKKVGIMGIYAGFKLHSGKWSCQRIFSRSTLTRLTVPRNELLSSLLGAQGMYVCKMMLGDMFEAGISAGDSSISLAWECNIDARLKEWVFSRVRQIHRMEEGVSRYWVPTNENSVDIGTRGEVTLDDVNDESSWQNGMEWMTLDEDKMLESNGGVLRTYLEVCNKLTDGEKREIKAEEHPVLDVNLVWPWETSERTSMSSSATNLTSGDPEQTEARGGKTPAVLSCEKMCLEAETNPSGSSGPQLGPGTDHPASQVTIESEPDVAWFSVMDSDDESDESLNKFSYDSFEVVEELSGRELREGVLKTPGKKLLAGTSAKRLTWGDEVTIFEGVECSDHVEELRTLQLDHCDLFVDRISENTLNDQWGIATGLNNQYSVSTVDLISHSTERRRLEEPKIQLENRIFLSEIQFEKPDISSALLVNEERVFDVSIASTGAGESLAGVCGTGDDHDIDSCNLRVDVKSEGKEIQSNFSSKALFRSGGTLGKQVPESETGKMEVPGGIPTFHTTCVPTALYEAGRLWNSDRTNSTTGENYEEQSHRSIGEESDVLQQEKECDDVQVPSQSALRLEKEDVITFEQLQCLDSASTDNCNITDYKVLNLRNNYADVASQIFDCRGSAKPLIVELSAKSSSTEEDIARCDRPETQDKQGTGIVKARLTIVPRLYQKRWIDTTARVAGVGPSTEFIVSTSVAGKATSCLSLIIDPIYYGWTTANLRLGIMWHFITKLTHRTHTRLEASEDTSVLAVNIRKACKICTPVPSMMDVVNVGYLDRLSGRVDETDEFETTARFNKSVPLGPDVQLVNRATRELERLEKVYAKRTPKLTSKKLSDSLTKAVKEAAKRGKAREEKRLTRESNKKNGLVWPSKCDGLSVQLHDLDLALALYYFIKKASEEFGEKTTKKRKLNCYQTPDGVWMSGKRLEVRESPTMEDMDLPYFDLPTIKFMEPVVRSDSVIAYSLCQDIHWNQLPHRGCRQHQRALSQIVHIVGAFELLRHIAKDCRHCRKVMLRTIDQKMASFPEHQWKVAPPFYSSQIDVFSPLWGYSAHNHRSILKLFALVVVCNCTGAVGSYIMEKEDTGSVVKALLRHCYRYGFLKYYNHDLGTQLVASASLKVVARDIECKLNLELGMESCPKMTQAHYERGRVERTVRSIRKIMLDENTIAFKQSVISWETSLAHFSNCINNLPIARMPKSSKGERGDFDVLTKNRILVGRNNFRSLDTGTISVEGDPMKQLKKIREINQHFYKQILKNVYEFVHQDKWNVSSKDVKLGDLILFRKEEAGIGDIWKLGIVHEKLSKEGKPGQWRIRYCLATESTSRYTDRSSRELVIIQELENISYNNEEHYRQHQASRIVDLENNSTTAD